MADEKILDANGIEITVGAKTQDEGVVTFISDTDFNAAGTGVERHVTVKYGNGDVEHWLGHWTIQQEWICGDVAVVV